MFIYMGLRGWFFSAFSSSFSFSVSFMISISLLKDLFMFCFTSFCMKYSTNKALS